MNRNVSQVAMVLAVGKEQVKNWAHLFREHLSQGANPPKGSSRVFSDTDLLVLVYVSRNWETKPDLEAIAAGLNQGEHRAAGIIECVYSHTPLLQEPPDDLDETWRHGVILNGGSGYDYLQLARGYRRSAEALLESALKEGEPHDWCHSVLFAYRHALELYLKIIGEVDTITHSLRECVRAVEKRHGRPIPSPVKEWILELDEIDPCGTAFRYADAASETLRWAEYWVDLVQFRFAMHLVFEVIDRAILQVGATGKPAKRVSCRKNRK